MTDTMPRTARPRLASLNEKLLASRGPAPTSPTVGRTGVVGAVVRLAVILFAVVALAGLAVFALLPVVLLGVLLLLPALLPLLLVLGCLLGDSAAVAEALVALDDGSLLT